MIYVTLTLKLSKTLFSMSVGILSILRLVFSFSFSIAGGLGCAIGKKWYFWSYDFWKTMTDKKSQSRRDTLTCWGDALFQPYRRREQLTWIQLVANGMGLLLIVLSVHSRLPETVRASGQVNFERADNPWLPYSPDLNPLNHSHWGYLMIGFTRKILQQWKDLKKYQKEIKRIPADLLECVIDNFNVTGEWQVSFSSVKIGWNI